MSVKHKVKVFYFSVFLQEKEIWVECAFDIKLTKLDALHFCLNYFTQVCCNIIAVLALILIVRLIIRWLAVVNYLLYKVQYFNWFSYYLTSCY